MERFLAHSGMTLGDLRDHAQDPVFLGFMLDYALQDESLMLAFTSVENITPQALVNARHKLPGSSHDL